MNNLQKAVIKSTGNKGFNARCASTSQKQMEMFSRALWEGFSHVQVFICLFTQIQVSKHYIAMNKDEIKRWFLNNKTGVSVRFALRFTLR